MDLDKAIQIYMRDLLNDGITLNFRDQDVKISYNDETQEFDIIDGFGEKIISYKKFISAENYAMQM